MSLSDKRIATVGSGVMAEAMIAGLLRGIRHEDTHQEHHGHRREQRPSLALRHGGI